MDWIESANRKEEALNEVLNFEEFMDLVHKEPSQEIRPSCLYFMDMIEHFEKGEEKLFTQDHPEAPPVFGQEKVQSAIYQNLHNFSEEGFNNKFLLLVGPNGSSKSSIVKKIMSGAEEFSKSDEGKLYTFSWIFPIDTYIKGGLSLTSVPGQYNLKSYAHLEDKDISAILPSELKDHPILLIPVEYRQQLIDDLLANDRSRLDVVKKSYLYNGDISKRNRMIYDALLKSYKGDHSEVLKHIRVERFFVSRRYSNAAVTIEPQMHVDAKLQQITMDRRLSALPPSLQSLNLFSLQGEAVMGNRGILEFSDLLKRPLDAFKYLLMTMETKNINLQGILTELDIFFIGSSNEIHLAAFKQHPDYNSFKGRFNFIRVPYLLNYREEAKIYEEQIENLSDKTTFEPHALEALSLFAVMTRIRPGQEKNYENKSVGKLSASLSPLEKTLFLSDKRTPDRFKAEERQILVTGKSSVEEEFTYENLYEGKFGVSPRTIKQMLYEISSQNNQCTFIEILEYLSKFIERRNEHDFLNMSPQGEYHNPARFIDSIKDYQLDQFDEELRECLGLVDERSYEEYIGRYVQQISAYIKREKVRNDVTGKFVEPDQYFIKEFEKGMNLKEKPEDFRSHIISRLGAYSLDNPGKKIVYTEVFPNIIKRLQTTFREEQKKHIEKIAGNLVYYFQEKEEEKKGKSSKSVGLSDDNRREIARILELLQEKYSYTEKGTLTLMQFLIKNRY